MHLHRTQRRAPPVRTALLAACLLALAGCGADKGKPATQVAAKVNKDEISVHQINFALQQQRGLRAADPEAAGRQVLERLIDQELAVQKARELKLDRDPRTVQALEAARRDVLARAYAERVGGAAEAPSDDDVRRYYEAQPALFKERRIYSLQEIAIAAEPAQVEALRGRLAAARNIGEFTDWLRAQHIGFEVNDLVRPAEQVPLELLATLAAMRDGQTRVSTVPGGVQVLVLTGSRPDPVGLAEARAAIEQYLLNERRRELLQRQFKDLRAAAQVEYVGRYAPPQPAATEGAAAPAVVPATATTATAASPAAGAGALDASIVNKGLGIK